jgi:hypothetical protein
MMGYDRKYGRVTTEFGDIPDDEPVVVFRGRDVHLPAVLEFYRQTCDEEGSPQHHVDLVADTGRHILDWQNVNDARVVFPTSDNYMRRIESEGESGDVGRYPPGSSVGQPPQPGVGG